MTVFVSFLIFVVGIEAFVIWVYSREAVLWEKKYRELMDEHNEQSRVDRRRYNDAVDLIYDIQHSISRWTGDEDEADED